MCSGHGACHHGECHCNPGWGGISCEILKSTCPEQCSNHGTFSTDSGTCVCDANWTGADCSIGKSVFWSPEDGRGVVSERPAVSSDIYLRVDDFEMVFWTIYATNGEKKKKKKNAQHTSGKSTKCIFSPKTKHLHKRSKIKKYLYLPWRERVVLAFQVGGQKQTANASLIFKITGKESSSLDELIHWRVLLSIVSVFRAVRSLFCSFVDLFLFFFWSVFFFISLFLFDCFWRLSLSARPPKLETFKVENIGFKTVILIHFRLLSAARSFNLYNKLFIKSLQTVPWVH